MKRLAAAIASFSLFAMPAAHAENTKMPGSNLTGADVRMVAPALEKYRKTACSATCGSAPASRPAIAASSRSPR